MRIRGFSSAFHNLLEYLADVYTYDSELGTSNVRHFTLLITGLADNDNDNIE